MKKIKLIFMTLVMAIAVLLPTVGTKAALISNQGMLVYGSSYSQYSYVDGNDMTYNYNFNLAQAGRLTLTMSGEYITGSWGYSGVNVRIYDAADNDVYKDGFGTRQDNAMETISLDLVSGSYTLEISKSSGNFKYTFIPSYTTANETYNEGAFTKNNDIATASPYAIQNPVIGHLAKNDDVDYYVFKVSKDGFLSINLNSTLKGIKLNLNDAMGDVKYEEYNVEMGQHKYDYFVPKGTYYLSFSRKGTDLGYTGTYSFNTSYSIIPSVKMKGVTNVKTKALKIKYGRTSKASGYEIQAARSKNFKKGRKTFTISGNSANGVYTTGYYDKLKKNATYYVRVRAYVEDNRGIKHYSKWSNVKSATIRK